MTAKKREKPLCAWWVNTTGDAETVSFVRMETTAISFDEQGRERLERDETE